jgi:lipid A biosynthesis (KDO)2-(lauroyl)-lipid IVA acyltransferase
MNKQKPVKQTKYSTYHLRFNWRFLMPGYWGVWGAVIVLWLIMFLPASILNAMANKLGDLIRSVNKKRRRIARINIDLCFPELSQEEKKELIRKNFRHQARSVLYIGFIWWAPKFILKRRIVFRGQENIEKSLGKGRSVIFMAAHSLALDAAVSAVGMHYPSSGAYKPLHNKLVDWLMVKRRMRHGGIVYPREVGFRPAIKDLRGGSTMFYLPDEDLGAERSIFVPFFGVDKASIPVLGRLSKSCKADVIPCMVCYDEKSHRYIVNMLPALNNFPTGDDYEDTLVMNKSLEEIIRLCPSQYFWIMKLFKTRPDGITKLY